MRFTLPRLRLPFVVISRRRFNAVRAAIASEHFKEGYQAAEELWKPAPKRKPAPRPKKTRP